MMRPAAGRYGSTLAPIERRKRKRDRSGIGKLGAFVRSGESGTGPVLANWGLSFVVPGTPDLIPALSLGLSRAIERDSTLPRPQSKSHIFALQKRWISSVMRLGTSRHPVFQLGHP